MIIKTALYIGNSTVKPMFLVLLDSDLGDIDAMEFMTLLRECQRIGPRATAYVEYFEDTIRRNTVHRELFAGPQNFCAGGILMLIKLLNSPVHFYARLTRLSTGSARWSGEVLQNLPKIRAGLKDQVNPLHDQRRMQTAERYRRLSERSMVANVLARNGGDPDPGAEL